MPGTQANYCETIKKYKILLVNKFPQNNERKPMFSYEENVMLLLKQMNMIHQKKVQTSITYKKGNRNPTLNVIKMIQVH